MGVGEILLNYTTNLKPSSITQQVFALLQRLAFCKYRNYQIITL